MSASALLMAATSSGSPLRDDDAGIVGVFLLRGDLHIGVGLVLLEVEEGQAVIDGGVGAAGQARSWIDWSKPSVPTSSAPFVSASLPKLRGQRLRRLLALEVGEVLMSVLSPRTISTALEAM